jgi:hypothetical protein
MGEVHLDDGKYVQMDLANGRPYTAKPKPQVIGWLRRKFPSLNDGAGV